MKRARMRRRRLYSHAFLALSAVICRSAPAAQARAACPADKPVIVGDACLSRVDAFVDCLRQKSAERTDLSAAGKKELATKALVEMSNLAKTDVGIEGVQKLQKGLLTSYARSGRAGARVEVVNTCGRLALRNRMSIAKKPANDDQNGKASQVTAAPTPAVPPEEVTTSFLQSGSKVATVSTSDCRVQTYYPNDDTLGCLFAEIHTSSKFDEFAEIKYRSWTLKDCVSVDEERPLRAREKGRQPARGWKCRIVAP